MSQATNKSIFTDLWERRLPQFFATYLGVCWGILQFLNFVCSRYHWNSSVIDMFLIFAALLIPAVLIFTYNHGRPGKDSWTKFEKIFMPANFILAGVVAFLMGGSANAQTGPVTVMIENEEGEEVSRMVPSQSQTRSLLIFPFNVEEGDNEWLRTGMPLLLNKDLEQDMRVTTNNPLSLDYRIKSHNYSYRDKLPLSVVLDIAKKTKKGYIVTGDINKEGDGFQLDMKVIDNFSHGDVFIEKSFNNADIFSLVDEATVEISNKLFLKENQSEFGEFTDLPSSDLITPSVEAYESYIHALEQAIVDESFPTAVPAAIQAAQMDEKSAELKTLAAEMIRTTGDLAQSQKFISDALKLSKQLPERQQFKIKKLYWLFQNDVDKALSLMNNWVTLYPFDYKPHSELITFYEMTYQWGKAKDVATKAMDNGLEDQVLGKMADICIKLENLEEAETHLEKYYELYPGIAKEDTRLADVYQKKGDFEKAIQFYDNRLLDDPENYRLYISLGETYTAAGQIDKASNQFESALSYAKGAPDSVFVYEKKLHFLSTLGQTQKFIETQEDWKITSRKYQPELLVAQNTLALMGPYGMVGAHKEINEYYNEIASQNPQFGSIFKCVGGMIVSMFAGEIEKVKKNYVGECKALMLQGNPDYDFMVQGYIASQEGRHEEAVDFLNQYITNAGFAGKELGFILAEQYRKLGQTEKAINECQTYLKTNPYSPTFLYELAMAQVDNNDLEGAKATYDKLHVLWSEADTRFPYYDRFNELAITLNRGQ